MDSTLPRRLFALVLLCAPLANGCACSRHTSLHELKEREVERDRIPSERLNLFGPSEQQWDPTHFKEVQEQRAKDEADYRARNPGR